MIHRKIPAGVAARIAVLIALYGLLGCQLAITVAGGKAAVDEMITSKATKVTTVEGITEYRLDNGLRFLLFPDPSKQQVTVNITYLVGSRHESYGETGMAHLLEHLLFKGGTPDHPDIAAELTERGASPNGTTWYDRTNYFEIFPATDENLEWALDLEADRMVNTFILAKDLDSEMTVVRNEMESGENSPHYILGDRVSSMAFMWHNYGKSTIGARADVENVPIGRLHAFYKKYYQPDNAVLIVAGRFDVDKAIELIEAKFGSIPRPDRSGTNTLYPTYTVEPTQDGERIVTLERVGDIQLMVVGFHIPAGSDPEYPAISIMAHILGNSTAGRLYKNLVKTDLAVGVSAYGYQLRQPSLLFVSARARKEDSLEAVEDMLFATIEEFKATPPTEEEVNRAKTHYLMNIDRAFHDPTRIALQISEWASMGDWRLMFLYRDNLEEVTAEDVHKAANAYLIPSNRTIGYFRPKETKSTRAVIPDAPNVAVLVEGYQGRETIVAGESFDPTPENIENRTITFTLSSGTKIVFLPKQNRGDTVTIRFTLPHGTEASLMHKHEVASLAGSMLMRGTVNRNRQEIRDELDRLKASVSIGGGLTSLQGSISTVRENLPAVLRLAREMMREPAFDQQEFKLLVKQNLAGVESAKSRPRSLAYEAAHRFLRSTAPKGHPRYRRSMDERIEEINAATLDEIKAFSRNFHGASNGSVAVVGDFDPEEIRPILQEVFRGWTANEGYEHVPSTYVDQTPDFVDIETPDKANAVMYAVLNLPVYEEHKDWPAFALGTYMLGGGFLSSRLSVRIRQQDGLSYGVYAGVHASPPDPTSIFQTFAIFAPENSEKVVAAFKEEIARVLESGFEAEEVEAARKGYLNSLNRSRTSDGNVAGVLRNNLRWGRTMAFVAKFEAAIAGVTPEDIHKVMRKYLKLDKIAIFRAGDFTRLDEGTVSNFQ